MPGCERHSLDSMLREVGESYELGVKTFVLFPKVPDELKTNLGVEAYNPESLIPTPNINRAYNKITVSHDDWKQKKATAVCGPVIYRGSQFPEAFYGNVFIPEPAGHLLKRVVIDVDGNGKPATRHAYKDREFLASTDERCRFVNAYVGPDGCLYLVDMYRGLIQHKKFLSDYLKRQVLKHDLHKPIDILDRRPNLLRHGFRRASIANGSRRSHSSVVAVHRAGLLVR